MVMYYINANRKKITIGFDKVVFLLLYWLPVQDLVMGIVYRYSHSAILANILLYTKDVLLVILLVLCLCRKLKLDKINKMLIIYIAWIAIYCLGTFLLVNDNLFQLVSSARGLFICPAFILIGRNIQNDDRFKMFITNKYFKYLFFLAIIGIVEWVMDALVGTISFWTDIVGIGTLYNDIKNSPNTYLGLPGNFYGYSSAGFFTRKRLCSVWGNPLSSGYSFLVPTIYFIIKFYIYPKANKEKKHVIISLIFIIAILLTYTRAIILGMIIALFLMFIFKNRSRISNIVIGLSMVFFIALVFLFAGEAVNVVNFLYDGSTKGHIDALISNISRIGFIGAGVGVFGATESVYFSVWGQIGIVGLILFIIVCLKNISVAYKNAKLKRNLNYLDLAVSIAWVVFMITALISEQLTAFTTIAPSYILLGFAAKSVNYGGMTIHEKS